MHNPVSGLNSPRNFACPMIMKTYHSRLTSHISSSFPLSRSITPLFYSRLKTHRLHKSFPPQFFYLSTHQTDCTDSSCLSMFSGMSVLTLVLYAGLSWLLVSFQVHIKSLHIIIIIMNRWKVDITVRPGKLLYTFHIYNLHISSRWHGGSLGWVWNSWPVGYGCECHHWVLLCGNIGQDLHLCASVTKHGPAMSDKLKVY